jgi:hypothetical protein
MALPVGVDYETPEFFPQTVGLYICACGRAATEHGRHADELPPGWERHGDDAVVCAECAHPTLGPPPPRLD